MRFIVNITLLILVCSSIVFNQELNRDQKLQKIGELNSQIQVLEADVLLPNTKDAKQAEKEDFKVFRIMPRERDHKLTVQGGGSFYSFTTKSHDYQKIAQIGLEQNHLKVGFAGANYGFIADLGEIALADVINETAEANFLLNYKPPTNEPDVRIEQRKAWNYETDGLTFKSSVPAIVGHSYVLRSISFGSADILVAFKIYRKDADGSLIIFWKNIKDFETPNIEGNKVVINPPQTTVEITDGATMARVQNALFQKGFYGVTVEATTTGVTLRGNIPKGKMAEAVMTAQESGKRPVKNELTEQ